MFGFISQCKLMLQIHSYDSCLRLYIKKKKSYEYFCFEIFSTSFVICNAETFSSVRI